MKKFIIIIMILFISLLITACPDTGAWRDIPTYEELRSVFNDSDEAFNKSKEIVMEIIHVSDNTSSISIRNFGVVNDVVYGHIIFTYKDGSSENKCITDFLEVDEINFLDKTIRFRLNTIDSNGEYVFFNNSKNDGVLWIENEYDSKKILAKSNLTPIEDNWYIATRPEREKPSSFLLVLYLLSLFLFIVFAFVVTILTKYFYVFLAIIFLIIVFVIYNKNKKKS